MAFISEFRFFCFCLTEETQVNARRKQGKTKHRETKELAGQRRRRQLGPAAAAAAGRARAAAAAATAAAAAGIHARRR